MRAFYHPDQLLHSPKQFMRVGRISAPTDVPQRVETLLSVLAEEQIEIKVLEQCGLEGAAAVHTPRYLNFLATAFDRWARLENAGAEVLPNTFPYWSGRLDREGRPDCPSRNIIAETGYYLGDLAVPLGPQSWRSISAASQVACAAADDLIAGADSVYALCRPSGHHARSDRASGFCYLNNTAVAAQRLRSRFDRVAVLDIDAHHGDGTQEIFYRRGDVLTMSIHADPADYYPFFTGYAAEVGYGEGAGKNLNIPLSPGAGDEEFAAQLARAIGEIDKFGASALVVALGFDTHREDPIGVLRVSSEGFEVFGRLIGGLGIPTVIVQEGGYQLSVIGECLRYFLLGFRDPRRSCVSSTGRRT